MQQDLRGALDHVNRALKLDPKLEAAWLMAASLHMELQEPDDAIAAARKAISAAPNDIHPCQLLSRIFMMTGRKDQMVSVWRGFVQRNPQNAQGHSSLAFVLSTEKKYAEAVPELEAAAKLNPKEWRYEMQLAAALAKTGDMVGAADAFEKTVAINPTPEVWNDAGYSLTDSGIRLQEAERWATQAVSAEEKKTAAISLDSLSDTDLSQMTILAAYWDTLGWVYFREGKLVDARGYEAASLALGQNRVVADHIGQIDEKLGHRVAAIHEEAMAVASPVPVHVPVKFGTTMVVPASTGAPGARKRLIHLLGSNARLHTAINRARDNSSYLRTYRVRKTGLKSGSAEFFVLLSPRVNTVQVKFISGSEGLRAAALRLAALAFRQPFPDAGPAKILRRGVLTCSEGIATCDFVLLPPETVHSVE